MLLYTNAVTKLPGDDDGAAILSRFQPSGGDLVLWIVLAWKRG